MVLECNCFPVGLLDACAVVRHLDQLGSVVPQPDLMGGEHQPCRDADVRTSIFVAPASSAFSTSSLTAVARLRITWPLQIRCTADLLIGWILPPAGFSSCASAMAARCRVHGVARLHLHLYYLCMHRSITGSIANKYWHSTWRAPTLSVMQHCRSQQQHTKQLWENGEHLRHGHCSRGHWCHWALPRHTPPPMSAWKHCSKTDASKPFQQVHSPHPEAPQCTAPQRRLARRWARGQSCPGVAGVRIATTQAGKTHRR